MRYLPLYTEFTHVSFLASLSARKPIPVGRQDLLLVEITFCYWAPECWRRGWCPLANGSVLTPSSSMASSSAPAITTPVFPHLIFISPLMTLQFIYSLDFCLWICFLCLCPFVLAGGPHWKPSLNIMGSQGREKWLIFLYCFQSYHLEWAHLKTGLKVLDPFLDVSEKDAISCWYYSLNLCRLRELSWFILSSLSMHPAGLKSLYLWKIKRFLLRLKETPNMQELNKSMLSKKKKKFLPKYPIKH